MKRNFNTTGQCNPEKHYLVDPFRGIHDEIMALVEAEEFFLIPAPRQTGETTFLHQLAYHPGKYVPASK